MSKFILQQDDNVLDVEKIILINILKKNKYIHSYFEMSLDDLNTQELDINGIPIGTIEFVTRYLKLTHGFKKQNPIEIPKYLRKEEFLKREYKIVSRNKLPNSGYWFIKNASTLKDFSYLGNIDFINNVEIFEENKNGFNTTLTLNKDDLFIVSSDFNPISEYRVYVFNHEIEAIVNYNGDPTLFPNVDLINKAIALIKLNEKWLKSYTIDVMVNLNGTAIIEIHNFTSCGLYTTLLGSNLLYAYRDGIDYLLNDNKKIEL